jgi:hypothetical protein
MLAVNYASACSGDPLPQVLFVPHVEQLATCRNKNFETIDQPAKSAAEGGDPPAKSAAEAVSEGS